MTVASTTKLLPPGRRLGWIGWSLFAIMYSLTTLGIGAGVHRMLVHRSFKCDAPVKFFFCAIGQMACQ